MASIYGIRVFNYDMACYRTIVKGGVVLHCGMPKKVFFFHDLFFLSHIGRAYDRRHFDKYPRAGLVRSVARGEAHCPSDARPIVRAVRRQFLCCFASRHH